MSDRERAEWERWLLQARADVETAQFLLEGEKYYMACFVAQQAAEKALKAFLFSRGAATVFGHSIDRLCRDCAAHDSDFERLRPRVKNLDHYYIEARYPNGLPEETPVEYFERADAETAVAEAREVVDAVSARIQQR